MGSVHQIVVSKLLSQGVFRQVRDHRGRLRWFNHADLFVNHIFPFRKRYFSIFLLYRKDLIGPSNDTKIRR